MPGGASCSPCLMPATQTPPLKPRRSSHSTGPPKDSGPTPLLRGCCSSRVAPQGQTRTVRPEAESTLGWELVGRRAPGAPAGQLCKDSRAEHPLARDAGAALSQSLSLPELMKGCVKAGEKGLFCIYFNTRRVLNHWESVVISVNDCSAEPLPHSHTHPKFLSACQFLHSSPRARAIYKYRAGSWLVNGGQEELCFPSFSITPSTYTFLIAGRLVHNE